MPEELPKMGEPALDSIRAGLLSPSDLQEEDTTVGDAPKEGSQYSDRVIGFVDVLGFSELIRRSADDPSLCARIYDALDFNKDDLANAFVALLNLDDLKAEDFEDRFHSFSDFIVMSVNSEPKEVGLLVYVIAQLARKLLGAGFLCRGGIAFGKLIHTIKDGSSPLVFGPAFLDAYNLESEHADSPRIILKNNVSELINQYKDGVADTDSLKQFFNAYVGRASDGPFYVDFFADIRGHTFLSSSLDLTAEIKEIGNHLVANLTAAADTPRSFRRVAALAREFNSALSGSKYIDLSIDVKHLPR